MRHVVLATICALALAGCGGREEGAPDETQPAVEWPGVAEPRPRGGVLEVDAFRRYTEAVNADFEEDPEALVREYLRVEDGVVTVEGPRTTLLRDSLEDDSVRAERWVVDLARDGDTWTIVAARWQQRCHQGRGHQDFGNELCL